MCLYFEKQYNYQKSDIDFYEVVSDNVENPNNFKSPNKATRSASA